jgi:hypothetical protein
MEPKRGPRMAAIWTRNVRYIHIPVKSAFEMSYGDLHLFRRTVNPQLVIRLERVSFKVPKGRSPVFYQYLSAQKNKPSISFFMVESVFGVGANVLSSANFFHWSGVLFF